MADIGHNSTQDILLAADKLKSFIERIESLDENKRALQGDISEVFGLAKVAGFDPTIMRLILKIRKMDEGSYAEQQMLLDAYKRALGIG
jgi:uncharacterized protein (UPF0335 family)